MKVIVDLWLSLEHWSPVIATLIREKEWCAGERPKSDKRGGKTIENTFCCCVFIMDVFGVCFFFFWKTWFSMRLIVWCHFGFMLYNLHKIIYGLSSCWFNKPRPCCCYFHFWKCRILTCGTFTHQPRQTYIFKQLFSLTKEKVHAEESVLPLWCTHGTFLRSQRLRRSLCNLTLLVFLYLKAVWRRKSLLNVVPLPHSWLQVCQCRRERNAVQHQHSHRKLPLFSHRFLLMVV